MASPTSKRSRSEWLQLFDEHARSGLRAADFCRQRNISAKYFSHRKQQLLPTASAFVAVKPVAEKAKLPSPCDALVLQQGSCSLRLPADVSAQWLATLMRELN